jgi:hypothetical protein
MEANQLPAKPGPYYWRESDGDEFQLVTVELHIYSRNPDVVHLSCYSGKEMRMLPIKDLQGKWLPIPTAEELVKLQAKAKMVDEGQEAFMVFDKFGRVRHLGDVRDYAKLVGRTWQELAEEGYTCELATIIKEEKR